MDDLKLYGRNAKQVDTLEILSTFSAKILESRTNVVRTMGRVFWSSENLS